MSDDRGTVDRRAVLAAVAALGGAGAFAGLGTGALLADRERAGRSLAAGTVDLTVAWESPDGSGTSDGAVTFDLELTPEDDSGHALVAVDLPQGERPNNPAYLWLRSFCPTPVSGLGDALAVELWYADDAGDRLGTAPIAAGSLNDVAESLRGGVAIDGDPSTPGTGCLDAAATGPLSLRFEWALGDGYGGVDDPTTLTVEFVATQCRFGDATNPFGPAPTEPCDSPEDPGHYAVSYVEVWVCDPAQPDCVCVELGKLEVGGSVDLIPGTYDLPDRDGADTGYDLVVTDAVENGEGEVVAVAFEVVLPGGDDPTLCRVDVKGGRGGALESYDGASLDGNATVGLLAAPAKTGKGGSP